MGNIIHYCIEFAPIIVLAVYDCISRLRDGFISYSLSVGTLFLTMVVTYEVIENQVIWWQEKNNVQFYKKDHYQNNDLNADELYALIEKIPSDAIISAQSNLVSHLAFRDKIYQFPVIEDATYIFLVPAQQGTYPLSKEDYTQVIQNIINSNAWKIEFQSEKTLLLKKKQ